MATIVDVAFNPPQDCQETFPGYQPKTGPDMTDSDDGTLAFYDAEAKAYAETNPHASDTNHLLRFMYELPEGGSACDLGSGSGWAAAKMRDAGFKVTAIDGSTGLAAEAKIRFGLDVEVLRFEDFKYENAFDGLWAAWSLHHAPRAAFPELLTRVGRSVKPGGVLFIAMKGGSGERRDNLDRLYAYYEMDELKQLIEARIGADILVADTAEGPGFDGSVTPTHALIIRKRT